MRVEYSWDPKKCTKCQGSGHGKQDCELVPVGKENKGSESGEASGKESKGASKEREDGELVIEPRDITSKNRKRRKKGN